ncbi:HNH endonuclease [Nocardioides panacisoli]|uniref:HNH endonuclease signature motif containing protein n=1 Tax=Nocardioides panacisoli TaxID=627624 RepID=UPI001C629EA6|nr:HNH endonuclease signature motif containing protein [Nocardioides panacisoli]QYJ03168.1 HNH endonuclease [Nocardioides panacisoli]
MTRTAPAEGIAEAVDAVARLADLDWDELGDAEALAATVEVGRVRSIADGALTALAERIEAADAADLAGWASTKDFLTHALGGRKGAGGSIVRVAKQTAGTPEVRAALMAGEVSFAQASAIGQRVSTLPNAPELRQQAATMMLDQVRDHGSDATDLDRGFRDVVTRLDPDGTLLGDDRGKELAERGAHLARHLAFSPDTVGGVRIKGYATLEEAELVKATLMPLAAPRPTEPGACGGDPDTRHRYDEHGRPVGANCPDPTCSHDGRDPREGGVRLWDALVEACGRLADTDALPHAHGTTARLMVTTNVDDLRRDLASSGDGLLPSGDTISAAAVRRLACDAEVLPAVLGGEGQILDVGRLQRLVTTAIWHALVLRDQHCTFPGCTRLPLACDAHHITHWADGGRTSLDNLALLCRKHHTLAHHSPWRVSIDPHRARPVWTPPTPVDTTDRFTYVPPRARPPTRAA